MDPEFLTPREAGLRTRILAVKRSAGFDGYELRGALQRLAMRNPDACDAALEGCACVQCGGNDGEMVVVGSSSTSAQLFAHAGCAVQFAFYSPRGTDHAGNQVALRPALQALFEGMDQHARERFALELISVTSTLDARTIAIEALR